MKTENKPDSAKRNSGSFKLMNHPVRSAKLAFGTLLIILILALLLLAMAVLRQTGGEKAPSETRLLITAGEAELLERYAGVQALPERPVSVRLDGMMIRPEGESFATFTVDGVTATMVEGDYIGDFQVEKIGENSVELAGKGEVVVLMLDSNKLSLLGGDE